MWPFCRKQQSSANAVAASWEKRAKSLLYQLEQSVSVLEKLRTETSSLLDEVTVIASDARRHIEDHQRVVDMLKAELDVEKSTVEALVIHDRLVLERAKADIDYQVRRQVAFSDKGSAE